MSQILKLLRHSPLLGLLIFVPVLFVVKASAPHASTPLFCLSILSIIPLAALLSHATESVAARTGDLIGGLLNATLGNLTELVIALAALRAGEHTLVKASLAGAIVTNSLFMLGTSFFLGGLRFHSQEFNRSAARFQAGLLFLASIALLFPSALSATGSVNDPTILPRLSLALSILLIISYALGLLFSLKTHREFFETMAPSTPSTSAHSHSDEQHATSPWPLPVAFIILAVGTLLVALVSEVFVESVQGAALSLGMNPAFVGFIVVALVGAAAEMTAAFSAACKNRLDLSVGIALGSASQIALFVAPVLVLLSQVIGPEPMDLFFWPGAVLLVIIATVTATLITNSGRSTWFLGVLTMMVYLIFAVTLYLIPSSA